MPQPKSSRKPAAKKAAAKPAAKKAAAKPAAKKAAAKPAAKKAAAKPAAKKAAAKPAAKKAAAKPAAKKAAAKKPAAKKAAAKPAAKKAAAKKPAAKKAAAKPAAKKAAAKPAAKKAAAKKPAAKKAAAKKPAAKKPAARKPAAKKAAAKRASSRSSAKPSGRATASAAERDQAFKENLKNLRELLAGGILLRAQSVQDVLDNAVTNGRMLRRDAEDLARGLLETGRRQTQLLMADLEQLIGAGQVDLDLPSTGGAADAARSAADAARAVAEATGDRILREVDKTRRAAGIPPTFPILNYEELEVGQIVDRLGELTAAELRKVRDFERRHRNRSRVVQAIERTLT